MPSRATAATPTAPAQSSAADSPATVT
jgi:hypothetical protein